MPGLQLVRDLLPQTPSGMLLSRCANSARLFGSEVVQQLDAVVLGSTFALPRRPRQSGGHQLHHPRLGRPQFV